jgi:hypothetical protein
MVAGTLLYNNICWLCVCVQVVHMTPAYGGTDGSLDTYDCRLFEMDHWTPAHVAMWRFWVLGCHVRRTCSVQHTVRVMLLEMCDVTWGGHLFCTTSEMNLLPECGGLLDANEYGHN